MKRQSNWMSFTLLGLVSILSFGAATGFLGSGGAAYAQVPAPIPAVARDPATDVGFQEALRRAREQPADHAEDNRRAQVQAEALIRGERLGEAAAIYRAAVERAPDWSAGHFNLALVNAELQLYADAITAMRRYLYLEPNASDARQAQDQIYQWEVMLAAPTGTTISEQGDRTLRQQVTGYLNAQHGEASHPGYRRMRSIPDWINPMRRGAWGSWEIQLEAGVTYRVVGVCDSDCTDVDMALYTANERVATHLLPDDAPWVEVTPAQDGAYSAFIALRNCATEPCYVAMRVLRRN